MGTGPGAAELEVVFSLVGVSVVLLILIALVLLWSLRSGQFDDLEGPAWRVLMDDDETREATPRRGPDDPERED